MVHKGEDNLKRGKMGPQPHGGYLQAPPPGGKPENFVKARDRERAIREETRKDFGAALETIAEDLTILASAIMRRHARAKEVPPRATMDVLRELRQTLEAVNEARRSRGAVAEAESFFATLDSRMEEVATRLADGPKPAVLEPA